MVSIESVRKPNAYIQIHAELGLNELKIINFLIYSIHNKKLDNFCRFTTSIKELSSWIGKSIKREPLKQSLLKLKSIKIECNILDKNKKYWEIFGLLDSAKLNKDNSINLRVSLEYMQNILNLEPYRHLNFNTINSFHSKFSILLYENIDRYLNLEKAIKNNGKTFTYQMPKLSVAEVKKLFGIPEDKYKEFSQLNKRVLKVAVDEINKKSQMDVRCIQIKTGSKITHLKFYAFLSTKHKEFDNYVNYNKTLSFSLFDDYLHKYANEKIVGKLDGNDILYYSKDRTFRMKNSFGETILNPEKEAFIYEQTFINRHKFSWYKSDIFRAMIDKEKKQEINQKYKG